MAQIRCKLYDGYLLVQCVIVEGLELRVEADQAAGVGAGFERAQIVGGFADPDEPAAGEDRVGALR